MGHIIKAGGSVKLLAKITTRRVTEKGDFQLMERKVDIVSAFDMLDELEGRAAAPLRYILRWLCDREFPVSAELTASFQTEKCRITVKHIVNGEDIFNVAVLVRVEERPEEIGISFPGEAVKEL